MPLDNYKYITVGLIAKYMTKIELDLYCFDLQLSTRQKI